MNLSNLLERESREKGTIVGFSVICMGIKL